MIDLASKIDVTSRLNKVQAMKVLSEVFNSDPNFISFTKHAREQMNLRNLKTGDILNVLKAGKIHSDPEYENGSWRYRVQTSQITIVIAFRRPNHAVVVTAWREK